MVSENLRDDDGRPLMMDTNNEDECLAEKYHDPENEEYLLKLGVRVTSDRVFRNQLVSPLQSRPRPFLEKKPNAWHASLARIIREMYRSSTEYRYSPISDLPTIPLRGGEWVSPRWCGRKSYLSSSSGLAIPESITMLMVDDKAAADPDRWKLYQLLGIPVLTKDRIKEAIVNTHDDWDFDPNNLTPTVLVSHAEFIHNDGGWEGSLGDHLWVATYLGHCRKGNNTYRPDDDGPYSASRMLPKEPKQTYGFLHPAYFEAGRSQNSAWINFLYNSLGIWVIPRIDELKLVI
ncbi:hypothetical protein FALCPG4_007309 [Fusarium falciforme]